SGNGSISVSGTLGQIQADLATLSYTAGSTGASITIDVWDQAGVEASRSFQTSLGATTSNPTATDVVENASNTQINVSSGDHMIFIVGSGDTLAATGGNETIQAYQGGNSITSGTGDDTIRFAGTNNVIDAGGGANVLADSGTNNTLVLPGAGQGTDDV